MTVLVTVMVMLLISIAMIKVLGKRLLFISVCVQFYFKRIYIFSVDSVVHFLSGLYAGAVLCIQTRFKWCFAVFIFSFSLHNTSRSRGSTLLLLSLPHHCHFIYPFNHISFAFWFLYLLCSRPDLTVLVDWAYWLTDRSGWLGVKHQVTYLLIMLICFNFAFIIRFLLFICCRFFL